MPKSLKSCGIDGAKADRTGAKVPMICKGKFLPENLSAEVAVKFKLHGSGARGVIVYIVRFLQTFALLSVVAGVCLGDDFADRLYKAGQRAEKAGDKLHAFLLYAQAAKLDPANVDYAMRKSALQADAAMSANTRLDVSGLGEEHPEIPEDALTPSEIVEARASRPPPRLRVPTG
jgi:hypothetical protein